MTTARRHRVLKILGLNLAVIALILGAIEWYMRQTTSYIVMDVDSINKSLADAGVEQRFFVKYTIDGRRLVPNTRSRVMNHALSGLTVEMRVNALGFRGPEVPAVRPPGQLRVLALGDSITLASYLPEDQTWVARLERELDARLPGRDVLAINAGVVDVGIKEEVDILEEQGLAAGPDVVLVAFYLNDMRPPYGFPGEKRAPGFIRRHSVFANWLFQRLELKRFIKDKGLRRLEMKHHVGKDEWRHDRAKFMKLVEMAQLDWGSAWKDESWKIVDRQFDRLAKDRDRAGFKVAVAAFPVYFQVYADFLDDRPQQILAAKAAEHGFAFTDLLPAFRDHQDQDLFYDHCHLQPAGNDLAARELADFLVRDVVEKVGSR